MESTDLRFPPAVKPSAGAPGCRVAEILADTVEHDWDAHRYENTLPPFLRSRESALITRAVAGSGTGCAHVEIDAAKYPEISAPESTSHCPSSGSVRVAVFHATAPIPEPPIRELETPRLHSERASRNTSTDSASSNPSPLRCTTSVLVVNARR